MAPYQVQTIYGAADRSEPGRLEYRRRGITFEFEGGTVRAMSVFRPGTS